MQNKLTFSEVSLFHYSATDPVSEEVPCFEVQIAIDIYLMNHSDVAWEYLEVAFIAQKINEIAEIIRVQECSKADSSSPYPTVALFVNCSDRNILKNMVSWLQGLFRDQEDAHGDSSNPRDEFYKFEESVSDYSIEPTLPEYCDKYFANLIASNYDWSKEGIDQTLFIRPEWAFHTWKSSWSKKIGFDLYVSPEYWLLSKNADLILALQHASDYSPNEENKLINPITVLADMSNIFLFAQNDVVCMSMNKHFLAARCAEIVFPYDENRFENTQHNWGVSPCFAIANDLSFVIFDGATFRYVMFRDAFRILNTKEVDLMTSRVQELSADLLERGGTSITRRSDWSLVDDEKFEKLCYDLVLRDGRFISRETKKMGTSRSRDGGRDIVTKSASRSGQRSSNNLWIVQCKFSKSRKSLGRDDVRLGDLIDEYAPAGVIIATNMVIDAGTYDKYEKIKANRKVEIESWDGLFIERLLNKNPDLFRYYLNNKDAE
jgi:hypothetical protein